MKRCGILFFILCAFLFFSEQAFSHCQVPCGIYDDEMRVRMIGEDITTVEKSMKKIAELSKEKNKNYNQIVRWVNNKDHHADKIADTVTYYFMAQRNKQTREDAKKLTLLHRLLYYSMKAKQTTDLSYVEKMRSVLEDFRIAYFGKE